MSSTSNTSNLDIIKILDLSGSQTLPKHLKSAPTFKSELIKKNTFAIDVKTFSQANVVGIYKDDTTMIGVTSYSDANDKRYYQHQITFCVDKIGKIIETEFHPEEKDSDEYTWPLGDTELVMASHYAVRQDTSKIKVNEIFENVRLDFYKNIDEFKTFLYAEEGTSDFVNNDEYGKTMLCDYWFIWKSYVVTLWRGCYYIISDYNRKICCIFKNTEYYFQDGDHETIVLSRDNGFIIYNDGDVYSVLCFNFPDVLTSK